MPGSRTSTITHRARAAAPAPRNASAEANISASYPADSRTLCTESRTRRSSSTAAAITNNVSVTSAQSEGASAARNKALVQAGLEGWAAGTGSRYELLADDATWTFVGRSAASKTYQGREAFMREVIRPFNARRLRITLSRPTTRLPDCWTGWPTSGSRPRSSQMHRHVARSWSMAAFTRHVGEPPSRYAGRVRAAGPTAIRCA